ncbi:hypothetical protein PoB_001179900 [Plakobranchus ocellatus]|uniref:Uncharacterized protein n=1 Tax=Plakobranchus ocellatus TaxID=259542 RepID=A0AAV3YTB6_9GAST|nr:hypothetical protein PoB_001179900 [Plakobranchus ocellatus]
MHPRDMARSNYVNDVRRRGHITMVCTQPHHPFLALSRDAAEPHGPLLCVNSYAAMHSGLSFTITYCHVCTPASLSPVTSYLVMHPLHITYCHV